MKPKHRRLAFIGGGVVLLGAATALVLSAFQDNLVFFYSPSDLVEREVEPGRRFRLGGWCRICYKMYRMPVSHPRPLTSAFGPSSPAQY